jgi:hypothetical protein
MASRWREDEIYSAFWACSSKRMCYSFSGALSRVVKGKAKCSRNKLFCDSEKKIEFFVELGLTAAKACVK